jgi:hypothetical protein
MASILKGLPVFGGAFPPDQLEALRTGAFCAVVLSMNLEDLEAVSVGFLRIFQGGGRLP